VPNLSVTPEKAKERYLTESGVHGNNSNKRRTSSEPALDAHVDIICNEDGAAGNYKDRKEQSVVKRQSIPI